jgi:hypothetical protein
LALANSSDERKDEKRRIDAKYDRFGPGFEEKRYF